MNGSFSASRRPARRLGFSPPGRQAGAALLLILSIVMVGAIAWAIQLGLRTAADIQAEKDARTQQALMAAKEALIAWSVSQTSPSTPGMMPCPEDLSLIGTSNEGQAQSGCGNALVVGRLPWKTLQTGRLIDGDGEALWYALSPGFRQPPINLAAGPYAQLILDGAPNVVAIIFSPGPPLAGQTRNPNAPAPGAYLDGENANGDLVFTGLAAPNVNDRALAISQKELLRALARRALNTARGVDNSNGLRRYFVNHSNSLPYAAATPNGSQIANNSSGWLPLADLDYPDAGSAWILPPPPASRGNWTGVIQYQRLANNQAKLSLSWGGLTVEETYDFP